MFPGCVLQRGCASRELSASGSRLVNCLLLSYSTLLLVVCTRVEKRIER